MKFITDSVWAKRGGILLLIGLFLPMLVPTSPYYGESDVKFVMFWDFLGGDVPGTVTMMFLFITAIGITALAMSNSSNRQSRSLTLTIMTGMVCLYLLAKWSKLLNAIPLEAKSILYQGTTVGLLFFIALIAVFIGLAILTEIIDNKQGKMVAGIGGSVLLAFLILPIGQTEGTTALSLIFEPETWKYLWGTNLINGMLIAFAAMAIGIFIRKTNITEYVQNCIAFGTIIIYSFAFIPPFNILLIGEQLGGGLGNSFGDGDGGAIMFFLIIWSKLFLIFLGFLTILSAGVLGLIIENIPKQESLAPEDTEEE
ncbi:MAG: hypothetical protein QF852_03035 [Candidatus Marinimicrobia bacterium]|jgi:hypothetical protein|nr:hypothetical protein [Candidatus Neomarinimicrobiota bacterium]